ncbi:MAG TPA: right-handed parallel beta-helix repeat-containing protein [Longimicrobium sp.]|jgi:hypothetical protein
MIKHVLASALCLVAVALAAPSDAAAQATRTWVSGVGDDVNPCSRTAPCKTFAGAISKTAAGGEIDCLDPGGFGGVTITKSITIDCNGVVGSALFAGATSGISVNGTDIVVVLRNLQINGAGTGQVGVRFVNGKRLILENVLVSQSSQAGIRVLSMPGSGHLVINNSQITNNSTGIRTAYGITSINNSTISGNAIFGLIAENTGVINANDNMLAVNGIAVQAGDGSGVGQSNAFVNLSNNGVHGNLTAFVCAGGFVASDGSNRLSNNGGGGAAPCTPNAVMTKQ